MDNPTSTTESQGSVPDFITFLEKEVEIEDADTQAIVPFKLWPHQSETADELVKGQWLIILKARQLGFTWLLAAYSIWLTLKPRRRVLVFFQDKEYAWDFLDHCRFIHDQLKDKPCYRKATVDNRARLEFDENHYGSYIRALAATKRAGHSISASLLICDEAAFIERLKQILNAARPTLETNCGQAVVLSTSNGPSGHFWELWRRYDLRRKELSAPTDAQAASPAEDLRRFKTIFYSWRNRPKRTDDWYNREKANNDDDPLYMKRQYPASPEEAFESAEGRIYPLFTAYGETGKKFIRKIVVQPSWLHYRAMDFGGVNPFVCLWACVVPGDPPGLTVDPSCDNLIREMLAYSYDRQGQPQHQDNHAPDALRYLIITPGPDGLSGHVHVYHELYVPKSAEKGLGVPELAAMIRKQSGIQSFKKTVADRSRPDSIVTLCANDVRTVPSRVLTSFPGTEVEEGIARVNALINASAKDGPSPAWLTQPRPPKRPPPMNFRVQETRPTVLA